MRKLLLPVCLSTSFLLAGMAAATEAPLPNHSSHTVGINDNDFLIDGKPIQIISGEMHYPRVPKAYWRDRMKRMKAMGCNTLCTYIFWNMHEPKPGEWDFSGNLDIAEYCRIAQEEGLWVIVRPGPEVSPPGCLKAGKSRSVPPIPGT